jgi:hypothetical protein
MSSGTKSYAFCADYSNMAQCLLAIKALEDTGAFAAEAEILKLLHLFEHDLLRKLYLRTIRVLRILEYSDGNTYLGGDFNPGGFTYNDFHVGYLLDSPQNNTDPNFVLGDYQGEDYLNLDYHVGYSDPRENGYGATFEFILTNFKEFCRRAAEISEQEKAALDAALIPVLDAFAELQKQLISEGLNPCQLPEGEEFDNSPGVMLQAAGADGTDGFPEGIHLRWSLTGEMGSNHIPRGTYSNNSGQLIGYNRPNDFIKISRIPYLNPVVFSIDFENDRPVVDFLKRRWTYTINQTVNGKMISNRIRVTFSDKVKYNQLMATANPTTGYFSFLKQYNGILVLEVLNKTAFKLGFDFRKNTGNGGTLKIEALCTDNVQTGTQNTLTIRKTILLDAANAVTDTMLGENIKTIRLKKNAAGYLQKFSFETYSDFLATRNSADWIDVGDDFSLSLNDQKVLDRLENASYPVNNIWPQYNNGTRVRVANYQEKWEVSRPNEPSIKEAITTYLALSETAPRANDVLMEDNAGPDDPGMVISYVDVLALQALDYHMARMLGLGHIDVIPDAGTADQYLYRLSYSNRKSLSDATLVNYSCLSLPVAKRDKRVPEKPLMRSLKYGIPVNDGEINTVFDAQGYTKLDDIRAVNIGREPFADEIPGYDFFSDSAPLLNNNAFEHGTAVFYGIEYRAEGASGYVKPEITNAKAMGTPYYAYDNDFPEIGVLETVPALDDPTSLYIHFEQEPGIHHYAIYGINWFGRPSAISDEVATDVTAFPLKNSLIPPTDLAVQYIQEEETLLFTTTIEQNWLKGRTETFLSQDVNFTRLTFNWLDIADVSNLKQITAQALEKVVRPDKVKVFFKPSLPLEITGVIRNILPVADSDTQLRLYTGSYLQIDGALVEPSIAGADFFRFTNSLLSTVDGQYHVIRVESGTDWPIIVIEKILDVSLIDDAEDPGEFGTLKTYSSPDINSRFSMVENLSNQANWEPVAEEISIVSFADPDTPNIEETIDSEGNITKQWIGGVTGNAIVTPMFSTPAGPDDFPGYYMIAFDASVTMPPHPQINLPFDPADPGKNSPDALHMAHVEWYRGSVRMTLEAEGEDKKLLEVHVIDQSGVLTLFIYDPTYMDTPIKGSTGLADFVQVNFHPGYRVYVLPEPPPAYAFNRDHILPLNGDNDKRTLLGLQTVDARPNGSGFVSQVSMPAVLVAQKIEEPIQFEEPIVPGLRVTPDATDKAAFTFDIRIAPAANGTKRTPFGFTFFRTTHEDVMYALYADETVTDIFASLDALEADPSYDLRYYQLVNLIFDPAEPSQFRVFDAIPEPYGFPAPDRPGLTDPGDSIAIKLEKFKTAIRQTLLPLTEQTPIFSLLKEGYQTENRLPVIRDIDGNLLSASNPAFNPFPMVRKFVKDGEPNTTYIRFTDYILSASSRNLYFYAGNEVTNQLKPGLLSLFAGPVTILHTSPAEAPLISKFTIVTPPVALDSIAVVFQIGPMQFSEHISRIRVYRTTNLFRANTLQTMDSYFDVEIEEGVLTGYEITDNFEGMTVLPLGELVYYRFAGIRTIINEFDEFEDVFSEGSEVVSVRLIDTINPNAPDISYDAIANKLSWLPTTNNGLYYLYKQNIKGNWERIYTVTPPDVNQEMEYVFPEPLVFEDDEGNRIYYRFKVQVQNSSGLLNLVDNEVTI